MAMRSCAAKAAFRVPTWRRAERPDAESRRWRRRKPPCWRRFDADESRIAIAAMEGFRGRAPAPQRVFGG
ncbi:MAG: hypothetical protein IJG84_10245 [Kiritimatiellae bacterium]|nr:hypothetical protein [Kiritimatiellia bacterium]